MIFDLDDKTVNVEIPLTTPKLKPEIIDYLYNNYESKEIHNKLKDYKNEDHYEKSVETVGIWMSGGADCSFSLKQIFTHSKFRTLSWSSKSMSKEK